MSLNQYISNFIEKTPTFICIFLILCFPPIFTPIYFYPKIKGPIYFKILKLVMISIISGLINYYFNLNIFKK